MPVLRLCVQAGASVRRACECYDGHKGVLILKHTSKNLAVITIGLVLLTGLPVSGACQPVPIKAEAPAGVMEEVIVLGEKSLMNLQRELYIAEDELYGLFNSFNTDDDLDVSCYREAAIGTRIKQRVCRTKLHQELLRRASQRMMQGERYVYPAAEIKHLEKRMLAEMTKKALENPEMMEALVRATEAKNALESERERRCEGKVLFCW